MDIGVTRKRSIENMNVNGCSHFPNGQKCASHNEKYCKRQTNILVATDKEFKTLSKNSIKDTKFICYKQFNANRVCMYRRNKKIDKNLYWCPYYFCQQ